MQDQMKPSVRLTAIHFANGITFVAPTDQWLACIFDVLHPTQQEAILERIQAMAQAQAEDKPLVTIPGFAPQRGG